MHTIRQQKQNKNPFATDTSRKETVRVINCVYELEHSARAGIPIPPRKLELLAEKILQVANNDELRKELIERGLKRVEKYDWDKLITKYEKTYKSVIHRTNLKLKA